MSGVALPPSQSTQATLSTSIFSPLNILTPIHHSLLTVHHHSARFLPYRLDTDSPGTLALCWPWTTCSISTGESSPSNPSRPAFPLPRHRPRFPLPGSVNRHPPTTTLTYSRDPFTPLLQHPRRPRRVRALASKPRRLTSPASLLDLLRLEHRARVVRDSAAMRSRRFYHLEAEVARRTAT